MNRIDAETMPPASGTEANYVTRDLEIDLEAVVAKLIEAEMLASGCGRRQAAVNVKGKLEALLLRK